MLLFLTTNMAGKPAITISAASFLCLLVKQQIISLHAPIKGGKLGAKLTHAFDWTYHFSHVKKTSFTILIGSTVSCFSRVKNIPSLFG